MIPQKILRSGQKAAPGACGVAEVKWRRGDVKNGGCESVKVTRTDQRTARSGRQITGGKGNPEGPSRLVQ